MCKNPPLSPLLPGLSLLVLLVGNLLAAVTMAPVTVSPTQHFENRSLRALQGISHAHNESGQCTKSDTVHAVQCSSIT